MKKIIALAITAAFALSSVALAETRVDAPGSTGPALTRTLRDYGLPVARHEPDLAVYLALSITCTKDTRATKRKALTRCTIYYVKKSGRDLLQLTGTKADDVFSKLVATGAKPIDGTVIARDYFGTLSSMGKDVGAAHFNDGNQ